MSSLSLNSAYSADLLTPVAFSKSCKPVSAKPRFQKRHRFLQHIVTIIFFGLPISLM
jgi:hypothetical protein